MASQRDFHDYKDWAINVSRENRGTRIGPQGPRGHEVAPYVPLQELKQHWQPDLVQFFLNSTSVGLHVDTVVGSYLRIFAILAFISSPQHPAIHYLAAFSRLSRDDAVLPFRRKEDLEDIFIDPMEGPALRDKFYEWQFMFNPRQLAVNEKLKLHDTDLVPQDILPMVYRGDLTSHLDTAGSGAELRLFELASSSGLHTVNQYLVAKIYPEDEREFTFRRERDAYSALNRSEYQEDAAKYFLTYYGSFSQNGRGVILLEYADQGSLLDFFKQGRTPHTREEMFDLWWSLADLFRALAEIHNLDRQKTGTLRGVHQDLKPPNIFVFRDGDPSKYKFRFKIGDFGLSSFKYTQDMPDSLMPDNKSTKVYGAPELMTWDPKLDHIDGGVTPDVDIWSLGCVLFETVVWTICGERGREEFLADRQLESQSEHSASAGSFHNGTTRLQAVDNMVKKLLERRRVYDTLTKPLCEWLCGELLIPKQYHGRQPAKNGTYRLQQVLIKKAMAESSMTKVSEDMQSSQATSLFPFPLPQRQEQHTSTGAYYDRPAPATASPPVSADSTHPNNRTSAGLSYHSFDHMSSAAVVPDFPHINSLGMIPGTTTTDDPHQRGLSRNTTWVSSHSHSIHPEESHSPYRYSNSHSVPPTHSTARPFNRPPTLLENTEEAAVPVHPQTSFGTLTVRPPGVSPEAQHRPRLGDQSQTVIPLTQQPAAGFGVSRMPTGRVPERKGVNEVTIKELLRYKEQAKRSGNSTLPEALQSIPDMLAGRDQVFLIDNSQSMLRHWADVKKVVEGLVWVVKRVDPDGVEMRFTSKPTVSFRSKNTTELLDRFASNTPQRGSTCVMETALNNLINDLVPSHASGSNTNNGKGFLRSMMGKASSSSKTGISLYILTNGVWGDPSIGSLESSQQLLTVDLCGVDKSVETLINRLHKGNQNRSYVTLQFIRFGHDAVGKRRLRYLDNEMQGVKGQWDIVDRRYYERGVRAMLIGAMAEKDYPSDDSEDDASVQIDVR